MKKQWMLPLAAVLGGAAAFVLRLAQMRTGFEADTGLPVPGNIPGTALLVFLIALAVLFLLLVRRLPKETEPRLVFPTDFATGDAKLLTLPVAGVFLVALSGLMELLEGLGGPVVRMSAAAGDAVYAEASVLQAGSSGFSPRIQLALGVLSVLSAAALFFSLLACRSGVGAPPKPFNGNLLLVPPVYLVVRLVLTYREVSTNPSPAVYYVELLALASLAMGFYHLSSFAFHSGQPRRFALYAGAAVVMSITTLADGGHSLSTLLLYAGSALALLGFLLLCLAARPQGRDDSAIIA